MGQRTSRVLGAWFLVLASLPLALCTQSCQGDAEAAADGSESSGGKAADAAEVARAFCQDVANTGLRRLPGARVDVGGFETKNALAPHITPVCACAVGADPEGFLAFFFRTPLSGTFLGGASWVRQALRSEVDFGALYHERLQACAAHVNVSALNGILNDAQARTTCSPTPGGASSDVYGANALLQAMFGVTRTDFTTSPGLFADERTHGCMGSSVGTFSCDQGGRLALELGTCPFGCANGSCCATECRSPEPDIQLELEAPDIATPGCPPAPASESLIQDKPMPTLELPDCAGDATSIASSLGPNGTIIYLFSAWCPVCVQQLPVVVSLYKVRLRSLGIQLVVVIGRDAGYSPPTQAWCYEATARYGLGDLPVFYDPTQAFLTALAHPNGGAAEFLVLDEEAVVRFHASKLGSLDDLLIALRRTLNACPSEG